jgi:Domain of Unknown Function (DUF1080)
MLRLSRRCRWTSLIVLALGFGAAPLVAGYPGRWKAHDTRRSKPPIVRPAKVAAPVPPPSDAVVLFDGKDLAEWRSGEGEPAKWIVRDGYMESVADSGYLRTARAFGDCQLHVEWAAPTPPNGSSQARGNSGVFPMGKYEIQVLDNFENETYADGMAASVYGQYPPLVNACLPPGQWQTYDIIFRRPRFNPDGTLARPARITVLHNGVLVQDNVEPWGPTSWLLAYPYTPHADRLPLSLQDHGNPVRYRNIWLRELPESDPPGPPAEVGPPVVTLPPEVLAQYIGRYGESLDESLSIVLRDNGLAVNFWGPTFLDLIPHSPTEFSMRYTAGRMVFTLDDKGKPTAVEFHLGGDVRKAKRLGE